MEEVDKNPQLCTTYNLQSKDLQFDSTTLYVKNIPSFFTNEAFFSLLSENGRRIKKHHLFPTKNNNSTTVGLVTFMSKAEAEDAIYWLNWTPPHRFQLQYAENSTKDIKNFCNPWWNAACEEAYRNQKRAYNKYHRKPIPQLFDDFNKVRAFFRKVRRQSERVYNESQEKKNKEEDNNIEGEKETESVSEPEPVMAIQIVEEKSDNSFAFSSSPNLETIRQEVAKFAKERNWDIYHQPRNLLLALVGEMGELSELFQWKGEVQPGLPDWTEKEKVHLGEELSDVLIYLIRLSDKCYIDLPSAVMKKIALNAKKYPATTGIKQNITAQCEPYHVAKKIKVEDKNKEGGKETESASEPEPVMGVQIKQEKNYNTFAFSLSPNLEIIRREVAKFAEERNWNTYHQPRNLLLALVGEMGELSELFQWKGEVLPGLPGWTEKEKVHLGEELSDVLLYLIRLSDKCNVDLPSAAMKKIALNAQKYPASKVYGSSKKYSEYQADS